MEKKLSDFLPYYIGCEMIYSSHHEPQNKPYILSTFNIHGAIEFGDRPILRKLESMTDNEAIELTRLVVHEDEYYDPKTYLNNYGDLIVTWGITSESEDSLYNATAERCWSADQFNYLLKQGFDLFGLLDAGLGVDEKTIAK